MRFHSVAVMSSKEPDISVDQWCTEPCDLFVATSRRMAVDERTVGGVEELAVGFCPGEMVARQCDCSLAGRNDD